MKNREVGRRTASLRSRVNLILHFEGFGETRSNQRDAPPAHARERLFFEGAGVPKNSTEGGFSP